MLKFYDTKLKVIFSDSYAKSIVKNRNNNLDIINNLNFIGFTEGKGNKYKLICAYNNDTYIGRDNLNIVLYKNYYLEEDEYFTYIPVDTKKISSDISSYLKSKINNKDVVIPSNDDISNLVVNRLDNYDEDEEYEDYKTM